MLSLTERAQQQFKVALAEEKQASARLRVFIDHRCHCGKAHFSLTLANDSSTDDTAFEVDDIPFVADADTVPELPSVEIDFVDTAWNKGFSIRNVDHQCGTHMMR
ncbi:MAG: iron-sulfur cluster biosynthesis family protein [Dehalococcoidia bacterium]